MPGYSNDEVSSMPDNDRAGYIHDIEILRAFAILLVLFHHFNDFLEALQVPYADEAYTFLAEGRGVDLFFVISGFVIAKGFLPKLQKAASTQAFFQQTINFWIRRFWRLAPSAWLWLIIPVALYFFFNQSGEFGTLRGNLAGLAAGLLNIYNLYFASVFRNGQYANATFVHWTLSLEAQFYFILPFIIYLARSRIQTVLIILVIIQLVINRSLLMRVMRTDEFFIGVLIAIWQLQRASYKKFEPTFLRWGGARFLFICLALFGLMVMSGRLNIVPREYRINIAALISGITVLAASYNQNYFVRTKWLKAMLLWVGSRSYALYLIHIPVYKFVWEVYFRSIPDFPRHDHWPVLTMAYVFSCLLLTFFISELNFRFIEEPLRKRGRIIARNYLNKQNA